MTTQTRRFEIIPRPANVGGGWRLQLFEDDTEVGGGVYPPIEYILDQKLAADEAYIDAYEEGATWILSP